MNRRKFIYESVSGVAGLSILSLCSSCEGKNVNKNVLTNSDVILASDFFEHPELMNMGFHYTQQYSRRTRINVMGVVDQSSDEWERWYIKMHELESIKKMADAGYKIIEIHFMYGFGIEGEKIEYEMTKKMVENAHKVGIKVLGYFQFFSVQKELFFIENPWAKDCLQLNADGIPHTYAYDRPALCFTNKKVQDYYLRGVEIGLEYCGLDGIRLDNDYYKGCYCDNCQKEFKEYLKKSFTKNEARRVFGFEQLDEMSLVPIDMSQQSSIKDPLYTEMVKFRILQRQKIMKLISDKISVIKPGAVLGGNPAICRTPNDCVARHVYIPDLGETHNLVCSENSLFPARTGNSIRNQVVAYKYGQANNFKVFSSHHLYTDKGKTRWPDNKLECALSLCEALAFGGHIPVTTWGIRMENDGKTLYERPYFIEALTPIKKFLEQYGYIYKNAISAAEVGIYLNRETQISDSHEYWNSLQGFIQLLLRNKIPFRFVDNNYEKKLQGLKLLLVGNIRLISNNHLEELKKFANNNKIIATGESFMFDEYFLVRNKKELENIYNNKNIIHLIDCPERIPSNEVEYHGRNYIYIPLPPDGQEMMNTINSVYENPIKIISSPFVTIDTFQNNKNESFIHILNYDNSTSNNVRLEFNEKKKIQVMSPQTFGCENFENYNDNGKSIIELKNLSTYCVIKILA